MSWYTDLPNRDQAVDYDARGHAILADLAAAEAEAPLFLVFVYYTREHMASLEGWASPSSELYDTARSEAAAIAIARQASRKDGHEYSVEGGHYEPGSWDNPVFRGGERLR